MNSQCSDSKVGKIPLYSFIHQHYTIHVPGKTSWIAHA